MIENKRLEIFWTEKYRPKTLEDIILPEQEKENIRSAIKSGRIPHYLFIGPPGTGKTSLAKVIINELNAHALIINASEERGIDIIRDKVMRFVQVATERPKIVFLDEADSLTGDAQASLRNVMETYSEYCRFILTGNYDKFISPIKDRCEVVKFKQLSKQDCLLVLRKIVVYENIELSTGEELDKIIEAFYPSIRKMIATLQKYSVPVKNEKSEVIGYKLDLPEKLSKDDEINYETIFNLFRSSPQNIQQIRQMIYEQGITDFTPLYRFFFRKFVESKDELSAIVVTEYMYRDTFVADKELNFTGMLLALKYRAYPFIIGNNIEQLQKSQTTQQLSVNKQQSTKVVTEQKPNPASTNDFPLPVETAKPETIEQQTPRTNIPPLPRSKKLTLPKVNKLQDTSNTSTKSSTSSNILPVNKTKQSKSLQDLNKLLKKTVKSQQILPGKQTKSTDFTEVIDDIYRELGE